MKINPIEIVKGAILGVCSIAIGIMSWELLIRDNWQKEIKIAPSDTYLLTNSVQAYWQDHQSELKESSRLVTPIHLAEQGYLDSEVADRWESIHLKIRLPEAVEGGLLSTESIIEAMLHNGEKVVLLTDGSVHTRSHD